MTSVRYCLNVAGYAKFGFPIENGSFNRQFAEGADNDSQVSSISGRKHQYHTSFSVDFNTGFSFGFKQLIVSINN